MVATDESGHEHHIISKTLLKRWAIDGQLIAYNLDLNASRPRSPRSEGFITALVRHEPQQVEERWKTYEDRAPIAFAALDRGSIFDEPEALEILKDLFALHFARSRTMIEVYRRSFGGAVGRLLADPDAIPNNPAMLDGLFTDLTGLHAAGPGARLFALEAYERMVAEQIGEGGEVFVERIDENLSKVREMLHDWSIEIAIATEGEFLIGDDPVQTLDSDTGLVGILSGVPIGRADTLLMPFGPHHVVGAAKADSFLSVDAKAVDRINRVQVISAQKKVYFRPGSGLEGCVRLHRSARATPPH